MRNIILFDKQDITNLGIRYILNYEIVGEYSISCVENKAGLVEELIKYSDSVIILDYTLSDFSSVEELQILQDRFPYSSWILFSEGLNDRFLRQFVVLELAFSFILKTAVKDDICEAIRSAINYIQYLPKSLQIHLRVLNSAIQNYSIAQTLTHMETEILKEIALGKTTKEIAFDRKLSFHTITTHRKNIFRKLDVNNVQEAIKYAMRAGIVDVSEYYI